MPQYKQVEVASLGELHELINNAASITEMDDLRYACVKFMDAGEHQIVKEWQSKYQTLKVCPVCGRHG